MAEIGDLVPKAGIYTEPGVVVNKNGDGTVSVDTEPMTIHKFHRHTNTTGLTETEKERFNQLLDEIYADPVDVNRIEKLQNQIDEMKRDPANKNIVQYLRNQQAHLIRTSKQLPRSYNLDSSKTRGF